MRLKYGKIFGFLDFGRSLDNEIYHSPISNIHKQKSQRIKTLGKHIAQWVNGGNFNVGFS